MEINLDTDLAFDNVVRLVKLLSNQGLVNEDIECLSLNPINPNPALRGLVLGLRGLGTFKPLRDPEIKPCGLTNHWDWIVENRNDESVPTGLKPSDVKLVSPFLKDETNFTSLGFN